MERKEFLRLLGIMGLSIPFQSVLSGCRKDGEVKPNGKTVIVVGAGISGLAAAKKLKAQGFEVVVLEAQDKVGGRLRTDRSLGAPFDEGASWIHGINGNPITALAQEAGMSTVFTDDASLLSYDLGGTARSASAYTTAEDEFYSILRTLMNNGSATESFDAVFAAQYPNYYNDRLWRFFLSAFMAFDMGDLDNLSSLLYDEGKEYGGVEHIAQNGYDTIPNYLATDLNILYNQRVTKIDHSSKVVKVTHSGAVSEADFVLVTVPLGVLKANVMEFVPDLPAAKRNAIQKLGMGCANKFFLLWDTAFWDNVQYISYTPQEMDKFNYFVNIKKNNPDVNALLTFAYADYARQTEQMTDAQVVDAIMLHLRDIYGSSTPDPTQMLRTRWQSNENAYGSYSYPAVGSEMRHFEDLAEAVNERLFFAGEHTEVDYFSTAHGAYLSGIREADKIIDLV